MKEFKAYWKLNWDTTLDVFLIVVTTIIATITKIFYCFINTSPFDYEGLFKDGAFLMYSFSFLTSAYIIFTYQLKGSEYKNVPKIIFPFLLVISIAYTMVDLSQSSPTLNVHFIYQSSIVLFVLSLALFYYAQYTYNKSNRVLDVADYRRDEITNLGNSLS